MLITAILILCSIVFVSCKEEIEDTDLIIGKWRLYDVVSNPKSSPCALQSYWEFSNYVFRAKDRIFTDVVSKVQSSSTEIIEGDTIYHYVCDPVINYTTYYYTIKTDTLTLVNTALPSDIKKYTIKINYDTMQLKEVESDRSYNYLRWRE
jgi:hypothetical protein